MLREINNRADLLKLTDAEQTQFCAEIRDFLIEHVSDCGGHLASNLGAVEATVAIEQVYDTAKDRLVFDVGHQSYVHKILTGRQNGFSDLRAFGGLSGFPNPQESETDAFIAGHASNAVSVALGMARARTLRNQDYNVVAFVGDGSLTGGLSYEGLNDAGASGEKLVIVLNDNGMSISRNVGGISRHLSLIRTKAGYFGLKKAWRRFTAIVPGGRQLYRFTHWLKYRLKRSLIGTTYFEEMGLTYIGPVDGHDIPRMRYLLEVAKSLDEPVLLHIITQKGKGYAPAEADPKSYHGVGHFDPTCGVDAGEKKETYSAVFGDALCALAEKDNRICAVTAAMRPGTGLDGFAKAYPSRFFDVGIAEEHAVSMAAGMAKQGMVPVVAIYSTFLQRAYDMLLHDVALQGLHVVFAVDRCGLVGEDGATHHGVFDVGYLRDVPGMTVLAPATAEELRQMLSYAVNEIDGPVAIRYPRGSEKPLKHIAQEHPKLAIVTYGEMASVCDDAASRIPDCTVVRLRCLKPLPEEEILQAAQRCGRLLIVEDTTAGCAVGMEIAALLREKSIPCSVKLLNLGDRFIPHGDLQSLYRYAGIDADAIVKAASEVCGVEQ